jgi:hypothetical protein
MNAYIAELLVRDHIETLDREARRARLARLANAGRSRPGGMARTPSRLPGPGPLSRVVALLRWPAGA